MSLRLSGQRIIVTGGSRGIGAAIAKKAAAEGAQVAITFNSNPAGAEAVLKELPGQGHMMAQVNVSDEASTTSGLKKILETLGGVDGLVNNAGITKDQILLRMKVEEFDSVINTNLRGSFLCTREVLKPMMKARKGSVIFITSVVGQFGNPGQANYCASKAGMEAFSKSLAKEMAARNIRSNCVAPGFIETDMTHGLTPDQKETMLKNVPLGAIGTPEDVANAVCFLLSDESKYVTGHTLNVNGGLYLG